MARAWVPVLGMAAGDCNYGARAVNVCMQLQRLEFGINLNLYMARGSTLKV